MIQYRIERKNVKNINLRIRCDGTVCVSANDSVPEQYIHEFVQRKMHFIQKALAGFKEQKSLMAPTKHYVTGESFYLLGHSLRLRVKQCHKSSVYTDGVYLFLETPKTDDYEKKRRQVLRFYHQQCLMVFGEILTEVYAKFQKYGVEKPCLKLRNMKTRWGSCISKKCSITLNKRLIEMPRHCIEYVVTHELCHLIHPNHSRAFYDMLTMFMPDWRERKAWMDKA